MLYILTPSCDFPEWSISQAFFSDRKRPGAESRIVLAMTDASEFFRSAIPASYLSWRAFSARTVCDICKLNFTRSILLFMVSLASAAASGSGNSTSVVMSMPSATPIKEGGVSPRIK